MLAPRTWTSSLPNLEKFLLFVSHSICGILSQQLEKTKTPSWVGPRDPNTGQEAPPLTASTLTGLQKHTPPCGPSDTEWKQLPAVASLSSSSFAGSLHTVHTEVFPSSAPLEPQQLDSLSCKVPNSYLPPCHFLSPHHPPAIFPTHFLR